MRNILSMTGDAIRSLQMLEAWHFTFATIGGAMPFITCPTMISHGMCCAYALDLCSPGLLSAGSDVNCAWVAIVGGMAEVMTCLDHLAPFHLLVLQGPMRMLDVSCAIDVATVFSCSSVPSQKSGCPWDPAAFENSIP